MPNFKLDISYDGTNFFGWQIQKNNRTVQGDISCALKKIFPKDVINLIGSGRTDSKVHANQQIANMKIDTHLKPINVKNAINSNIRRDIFINSCEVVDEKFNARFSAISREYYYVISTTFDPTERNYSWYIDDFEYDLSLLNKCAQYIIGQHDFSTFCKQTSLKENNECLITYSKWKTKKNKLYYSIIGNRFLHHMVRYLVGTMVEVSKGKLDFDSFKSLVKSKKITNSIIKAPAQGLFLDKVKYE